MPGVVTIGSSAFIARYHVKPERRDEFLATFNALWRGALEFMNAQCNFVYYGWDRANRVFFTIESYKDESMLRELRKSAAFQQAVRKLLELCEAPAELQLLSGLEGDRAIFEDYPAGPSQVHPTAGGNCVLLS